MQINITAELEGAGRFFKFRQITLVYLTSTKKHLIKGIQLSGAKD